MNNIWEDRNWRPMLLKEIKKPFDHSDYIYELKFDGIRAIIFANPNSINIMSRNNKDLTDLYPELQAIKKLVSKNVIFDGEIIATENGYPSFAKLQKRNLLKSKEKIKRESLNNSVNYICFDILYENEDLTNLSLWERKKILNTYKNNQVFIKTKYIKNDGIKLFQNVKKMGLEGIVAKNINGNYHINERTDDFIKIKNIQRDEFIIGGYIDKNAKQVSLLLGEYNENELTYVGKVTMSKKQNLYKKLCKMNLEKNPFSNYFSEGYFLKPQLTCFVEYLERTNNNHLRHPVFQKYS